MSPAQKKNQRKIQKHIPQIIIGYYIYIKIIAWLFSSTLFPLMAFELLKNVDNWIFLIYLLYKTEIFETSTIFHVSI